ncbi:MAG TPA: methylmalonyl-CoA mutase [Nocardioides bacterium]|nr:methylmalonyl-CoA mutase [Nocardioides sp.]
MATYGGPVTDDQHDRAPGKVAWEAAAAAVLRKARRLGDDDPDEAVWGKLTRSTLDGIAISPLGTPELIDGLVTSGRPARVGAWDVRAELTLGADAKADNQALLADLEGGVTSLYLRGAGDWATVLDGILLDLAPVVLDGDARGFLDHVGDRELHPDTNLGLDARDPDEELAAEAEARGIRAYVVDATDVHDLGATEVQELAYALKAGADLLRGAADVDRANALLEFRFAVTDEQFTSIAKLRAARRTWARVLELSGAQSRDQRQHAVTSRPMLSKYDPWVNMLRTTVAAFAAGVGGADAVTVLPFDTPLGEPDGFGRRIARNTSALLIEESHVAVVTDPAGGAYAVEKLTDDLAVAAWELFGRLDDGAELEPLIEATVAERDRQVATRKRPITGLSEFPNLAEQLPERSAAHDAAGSEVRRYGAAYEALRDDPVPAPVLLAPLGTVAQHTARATFATNLLAAGGIGVTADGSGPVACVVGTDAAYAEEGAARAAALREAGAEWVIVAGKPHDWADDSCALGVDAIDFLTRTREKLA